MNAVWHQIFLDRDGRVSLVQQLANAIRHAIATSRLAPGETLPSVRHLARLLGITAPTVNRAYAVLVKESLLVSQAGSSTRVAGIGDLDAAATSLAEGVVSSTLQDGVANLVNLGFTIQQIATTLAAEANRLLVSDRICFVAESAPLLDKYERLLTDYLEPSGFAVHACLLSEIDDREPHTMAALTHTIVAACLLSSKQEVEHVLDTAGFRLAVLPILTQLTRRTLDALRTLPTDCSILVFAEPKFRAVIAGTLNALTQPRRISYWSCVSNRAQEALPPNDVDVLIHTLGCRDLAREAFGDLVPFLELEYLPRDDSLHRLATILGSTARRTSAS